MGLPSITLLNTILNNLPHQVYWKDLEGKIVGCNQQFVNAADYPNKADIIGKTDHDMPWAPRANLIQRYDERARNSRKTQSHENGQHFLQVTPLLNDAGEVIGIMNSSTDLRGYHSALEKKYARMEEVIAAMPGHVWWQDADGFIEGSNDQQAKTYGFRSHKDLIGLRTYELLEPLKDQIEQGPTANYLDLIDKHIMEQGKEETVEEDNCYDDGTVKVYLSKKVPLYDNEGKSTGIVGISFDITEYKEREEAWMRANGMIVDVP